MAPTAKAYDGIICGSSRVALGVCWPRADRRLAHRVLLLEAGGPDTAREIRIPAAFSKLFKTAVDWNYSTDPEPYLNNRKLYWPRGKVAPAAPARSTP